MRVLVVGGAGYVGSHCASRLAASGMEVVTYDNLSTGHSEAVVDELIVGDIRDYDSTLKVLSRGFDAVLHFAAMLNVGESMTNPLAFFEVNVGGTINLLRAMAKTSTQHLVFSSTCAVYGTPAVVPITENTPLAPINPYGQSKMMAEMMIAEAERVGLLTAVRLRYFNAAGAATDGKNGEAHRPETHLIPLAIEAAINDRCFSIFGGDHPTTDGTCIRDYIHVEDLAEAHFLALSRLLGGAPGIAINLGTGDGSSVRSVLDQVSRSTEQTLKTEVIGARDGDPPSLVADPTLAMRELNWSPQFDLAATIDSAVAWHRSPRFG